MKKIILGTALVFSAALLACNSSDSPEVDKSIMPSPSQAASPAAVSVLPDSSQAINVVNPNQPTITTTPAKVTPAIAGTGSSAPNPAHGQPGHRCDIAVGAPLNSAATIPSQPKVQQTVSSSPAAVTATPSAPTAIPVSTDPNAKLNPAHGQPGHDCSIAVGAPLKKN